MKYARQGFTLIEFLISLSLGLYLITFATSFYINLQKTLSFIQGVNEIETNGCIAFNVLTRDVRMAGFIGVPRLLDVKLDGKNGFGPVHSLLGWHQGYNTLSEPLPINLSNIDSDVLMIQYAEPNGIAIVEARDNFVKTNQKLNFHLERVLLIADCKHAETLQLSSVQLKNKYEKDAMLSPLYCIAYYVAPTGRKNARQQPIYALYRRDLNSPSTNPTELVEGVEKLEIQYGLLTRASSIDYLKANAVHNWLQVRSVQLTLHLTSPETRSLVASADTSELAIRNRQLKRQWQQTVMLRVRSTWT